MRTSEQPLTDFVYSLCQSKSKLERFLKNPRAIMREADLALKYQDALEDRDTTLINKYLRQEWERGKRRAKKAAPPAKVVPPPAGGWGGSGVKKVVIIEKWHCRQSKKRTIKRK